MMFADFKTSGNISLENIWLKINVRTYEILFANSLSGRIGRLSTPEALALFRALSNLIIPGSVIV